MDRAWWCNGREEAELGGIGEGANADMMVSYTRMVTIEDILDEVRSQLRSNPLHHEQTRLFR